MAINLNGTTGITTTGLTSNGIDDNATSTAITLDTSGNVLVGKTVANTTTLGNTVYAGIVSATMSGDPAIFANRAQDGSVIEIQKNGTTVGSIGAGGGRLYLGSADTGVYFDEGVDSIFPYNPTTQQARDNAIDLGYSTIRYKDLFLSGGVYLGGTGAANKLDDYEEGTWTPTFAGLTIGNGTVSGTYTKIGRQVTLVFGFICGSTTSVGTLGDITGGPFVRMATPSGYVRVNGTIFDIGSRWYSAVAALGSNTATIVVPSIPNYNSGITASSPMTWTTNDSVVFSVTYETV